MALTLPKLALPKLTLSKKQMTVAGVAVVLLAAAWFGWQYFEDAGPPPAPAKPQPVTPGKSPAAGKAAAPADAAAARDKLIADVLAVSGLKQQLGQLPQKLIAGVKQSPKHQAKASPAVKMAIEDAVTESFTAQGFHDRVSTGLKNGFDATRLQALQKEYSTPAAKRMVELEQAPAPTLEFGQFSRSAAATRPAAGRVDLLKRIDAATRASELAMEIAFSSMQAIPLSAAGGGAAKTAAVNKAIDKQRAGATDAIRDATLLNLAFSYRNASNEELEGYAKFYESENSKWLSGIVYTALLAEVASSSEKAGARIDAMIGESKVAQADKPASHARAAGGSNARADARACLDLATSRAIMVCAEKYR